MTSLRLVSFIGIILSLSLSSANDNYFKNNANSYGQNTNAFKSGQSNFGSSSGVLGSLPGISAGGGRSLQHQPGPKSNSYNGLVKPNIDTYKSGQPLSSNNLLDPYRRGNQQPGHAPINNNANQHGISRPLRQNYANNQQPQGGVFNQNNPYASSRNYKQPSLFRPVVVPDQGKTNSYNPHQQYAPVLSHAYIPPTTYNDAGEAAHGNSLYDVTNPLSNKKEIISSYRPQNNFVDPTHFIIPSKDKYDMISNIFGGIDQSGNPSDRKTGSNPFTQPRRSLSSSPRYSDIGEGLKNLGKNYHSQGQDNAGNFNLGFFKDDPYSNQKAKTGVVPQEAPKSGLSKITNPYDQPANQKGLAKPNIYASPVNAEDVYKKNVADNKQTQYSSTPYQTGVLTGYNSGQGYQNNQGFSGQGGQNFNNAYDTKSHAGNTVVSRGQGGNIQAPLLPQGKAGILPNYQNINLFNTPAQPNLGSPPSYSGSNVFSNQSPTPLFTSFTPNKRMSLDDFRSKDLLGGKDFGKTAYDQARPTSASILGSDLYRQSSFGRNNLLSTKPNQNGQYDKGGSGFNQVFGNTQTTGNAYDTSNSNSQGYNKAFGDNKVAAGGSSNFGGFQKYGTNNVFGSGSNVDARNKFGGAGGGNKDGFANQGGFSNSYQSKDSFKNGGGYSDGNTYADNYGFSDSNSLGKQFSDSDQNQQDYRDGYDNQQQLGGQKSFSNSDAYNDAYADGRKYDLSDGYTDKINYNNKDSDATQAQYSTDQGYKEGVANVGSALSGAINKNPYSGLNKPVTDGLNQNANYKPFHVNGPVFGDQHF